MANEGSKMREFRAYQTAAFQTARAEDNQREWLGNFGLGIAGEAGEVADMLKKHLFQGHDLDKDGLVKELGDVLWYIAALASVIGVGLEDIAEENLIKLRKRYPTGFNEQHSRERAQNGVAAL